MGEMFIHCVVTYLSLAPASGWALPKASNYSSVRMAIEYPPGLPCHTTLQILKGGDDEASWSALGPVKKYTNAFVLSPDRSKILLGMKKRGFGVDKYNGFGGKVELGESPLDAAVRELKEEAGIDAPLRHCGVILFKSAGLDFSHYIDLYRAEEYSGHVTESEEMRPEWFSTQLNGGGGFAPIPYERMWADDILWMPLLLSSEKSFVGRCDFGTSPTGDKTGVDSPMTKWWFALVDDEATTLAQLS